MTATVTLHESSETVTLYGSSGPIATFPTRDDAFAYVRRGGLRDWFLVDEPGRTAG